MGDLPEALRSVLGVRRFPVLGGSVVLAAFLAIPLLVIVPTSFSESTFLEFPPSGWSLRWYEQIATDPAWRDALVTSLVVASVGAALATIAGTAAALGTRRLAGRGGWLRTLFIAPIVLPYIVYVFGLYNVLDYLRVVGSLWPVMVAQAVLAFPVVFVAVSTALSRIDPSLFRAGASMGATWPTVVWSIELPLVRTTIVGAGIFAFAFCFDEVVVALFLGGPENVTLPVQIYRESQESVTPAISAVSTVVTVGAFATLAVASRLLTSAARYRGRGS